MSPSHSRKIQTHFQAELPMLDTHVHTVSPPGHVGSAPEPTALTLAPLLPPRSTRASDTPTATFLRAVNAPTHLPGTMTSRLRTDVADGRSGRGPHRMRLSPRALTSGRSHRALAAITQLSSQSPSLRRTEPQTQHHTIRKRRGKDCGPGPQSPKGKCASPL